MANRSSLHPHVLLGVQRRLACRTYLGPVGDSEPLDQSPTPGSRPEVVARNQPGAATAGQIPVQVDVTVHWNA